MDLVRNKYNLQFIGMAFVPVAVAHAIPPLAIVAAPLYATILGLINISKPKYLFFIFYFLSMLSLIWNGNILGLDFDGESMDIGLTYFANYLGYVTVVMALFKGYFRKFEWTTIDTFLLIFIVILFISGILSFDPQPMFKFFKRLPQFVMLYLLTRIFLRTIADFNDFFRLMVFTVISISIILLWQFTISDLGRPHYALMAFPLIVLIALNFPIKRKLIIYSISAMLSYIALFADSRRVFIAVTLWWILILFQSSKSRLLAIAIIILGYYSYDIVVPDSLKGRLDDTFEGVGQLQQGKGFENVSRDAMSDRNTIWLVGWKMFTENPIIGIGTQNSRYYLSEYGYDTDKRMHNYYLKILAETGVVGFLFLILIHGFALIRVNQVRKNSNSNELRVLSSYFYMNYVIFLVTSFFGASGLYDKSSWFTLGVIVSMHHYHANHKLHSNQVN